MMTTATISIFRNQALPRGPRVSAPTIAIRPAQAPRPDTVDAHLVAILDASLLPGETAQVGFARKERELGGMFAALSILDARALHARLANPKHGDELANKFARLTFERRGRLLDFLADARRRQALAAGGR